MIALEERLRDPGNRARLLLLSVILSALASIALVARSPGHLVLSSHGEDEGSSSPQPSSEQVPTLTVTDSKVVESDSEAAVEVLLRLSRPATSTVSVDLGTSDGTAVADEDYRAATTTATFEEGTTQTYTTLRVVGDDLQEADERFYLDVLAITGAEVHDGRGGISILDDDGTNEGRVLPGQGDDGDAPAADDTPPVIKISTPSDEIAPSGWYNIASSGTDGVLVSVTATDTSGVISVSCTIAGAVILTAQDHGDFNLRDGRHSVVCTSTDAEGNGGAGPGSTQMPMTFQIDQRAPSLECSPAPDFLLRQPDALVMASVSDAGSGPSSPEASAPADTGRVGRDLRADVSGSDRAGNEASVTCLFNVSYRFGGFQSPIRAGEQEEQAGRTIPVKWRISDWYDVGVDDPSSFSSITSFSQTCSTDRSGASVEGSPGASGLSYAGDGNWHFGWKTPKHYSGMCRTMSLNLDDGATDRLAFFRFR